MAGGALRGVVHFMCWCMIMMGYPFWREEGRLAGAVLGGGTYCLHAFG